MKGNYTAYLVPSAQPEGSKVVMDDDLEKLKGEWCGAMEIFETPDMTEEKLKEEIKEAIGGEMGSVPKAMRKKFKTVYKLGEFFFDAATNS